MMQVYGGSQWMEYVAPAGAAGRLWGMPACRGCRIMAARLTNDPAERARMTKKTLAEAEAKGLPLCLRCPGSTTSGKGNPR